MRFLFSTNPQDGHFRPMLPLARALAGAGHVVAFATNADWHVHVARRRRLGDVDLAAPLAAALLDIPTVNHSFGTMVTLASLARGADAVAPLWREHGQDPDGYAGAFRGLYVDLSSPSFAWEQPRGPSAGGLGPIPPRVRVERFVPQARVLPGCDVVVSHGGSGTTLGALAHGLPLVLVPQGADQFDNAARAERAGAAVVVMPDELDAAAVRAAVERVLADPSYGEAARRLAAEIAAMPSADEVAQRVESYAARG